MSRGLLFAAGAAALAVAAPAQQAARDWTRSVVATAEGGYRIGNPNAPVKLVEYGSLTCGHCAHFAEQGVPPLIERYVKTGKVSFEFRNFVRDPADMAAALLSRCASPANYFRLTDRYFQTQQQWMTRLQSRLKAQQAELKGLAPQQQIARLSAWGGLDTMAAQEGVAGAKAQACLADQKALARLVDMRKVAVEQHKLDGTPMFMVNGRKVEAHDWASLEPLLKAAGG